jgi:Viral BACON domain/RTX calcium-binding nonapeptide repeat (4 copies)
MATHERLYPSFRASITRKVGAPHADPKDMKRTLGFFLAAVLTVSAPKIARAACTSTFNSGAIDISCDGAQLEVVDIACNAGSFSVSGSSALPTAPACTAVTSLTVNGGAQADVITVQHTSGAPTFSALTSLMINGGGGDDTLDIGDVSGGFVALRAGGIIVDGGEGDDNIFGSQKDDILRGGPGDDRLDGAFGNDDIEPGDGEDLVGAGEGDDIIRTALAQLRQNADPQGSPREQDYDHFDGDSGVDTIILEGSDGDDAVYVSPYAPAPGQLTDLSLAGHFDVFFDAAHTQRKGMFGQTNERVVINFRGGNDHFGSFNMGRTPSGASTRLFFEVQGDDGDDSATFDYRCGTAADGGTFDSVESLQANGSYIFGASTIEVAADATSAEITATTECTGDWTAASEADWITVNTPVGIDAEGVNIPLVLQANRFSDVRTGYVSIDGFKIAVVQAGVPDGEPNPTPTPTPTPNDKPNTPPNPGSITPEADNELVPATPNRSRGCSTSPASLLTGFGWVLAAIVRCRKRS